MLFLMNHESYNFDVNVLDKNEICNDPNDLWSGNNAIPNLLFDDKAKFQSNIPFFKIDFRNHDEFLCFINSGGVISKAPYVLLPKPVRIHAIYRQNTESITAQSISYAD